MTNIGARAYARVCDMEDPLRIARDIVVALSMIAATLSEDGEGTVVQRLAWIAREQIDAAEEMRGDLFRLTHPDRKHFEKAGWPS
jgi:hypothetical protein